MKFKNKTDRDGYVFGQLCKIIGGTMSLPCLFLLGNEQTIVNKGMITPVIVSIVLFVYGIWRTGGMNYE